ncbi:hypothetical protein BDV26DRAFT_32714 [Aspergillus bertholletiae]|uniref:Uncharacterized protein n=1 Tax=Aspergillus bertholletiae TaxID=1226010 RepID=A0A5N7B107_9EURO|nr:hypothetical protein BDV26DRAFT_32714 [Aspergillus bertholletiae]
MFFYPISFPPSYPTCGNEWRWNYVIFIWVLSLGFPNRLRKALRGVGLYFYSIFALRQDMYYKDQEILRSVSIPLETGGLGGRFSIMHFGCMYTHLC